MRNKLFVTIALGVLAFTTVSRAQVTPSDTNQTERGVGPERSKQVRERNEARRKNRENSKASAKPEGEGSQEVRGGKGEGISSDSLRSGHRKRNDKHPRKGKSGKKRSYSKP